MIPSVLRLLWRLIILLLGIAILAFVVMAVWPETGSRSAIFFALLFTYCVMAYVAIPNLMRLFHVFSKPDHIPLYVTTGDGWPSDPVNLALVVRNRKQLERAMEKAGWHIADPLTFRNGFQELIAIILDRPYPKAPLSNLYLFDRPHDIGFEMAANSSGSPRTRHHVRFWKLKKPTKKSHGRSHYEFWMSKIKEVLGVDKEVWIGAATEDHRPLGVQWRTGQITHGVSQDADRERDFIIHSLKTVGHIKRVTTSQPGEKLKFHGQLFHLGRKHFRMTYTTDGSIKILHIIK